MHRPVMDPMFLREPHEPHGRPRLAAALAWTGRAARWTGRQLVRRPFRLGRTSDGPLDDQTTAGKVVRGLAYRMAFLPIGLCLASAGVVFCGTHPVRPDLPLPGPGGLGVYFDPINFVSDDGTRLEAWLVPAVDAGRVVLEQDRLFGRRYAAVVLAHDFGQSPHQMTPLLAPLHEDGLVVVAVGLRGVGVGGSVGQTFGVNESWDVSAAVAMLRDRPFVDPDRIAVLGMGTGANAALLAAERDGRIAAVGLADPLSTPDDAVARYVGPDRRGIRWMQVLNRWTFQLAYNVDLEDVRLSRADAVAVTRPVLRLDGRTTPDGRLTPAGVEEFRAFCRGNLSGPRTQPVPTSSGKTTVAENRPAYGG